MRSYDDIDNDEERDNYLKENGICPDCEQEFNSCNCDE